MGIIPKQNGNFGIRKNEVIFHEGQETKSVSILLQGKIDVLISPYENLSGLSNEEIISKSFKIFSVNHNLFIGSNDLCKSKNYSFTYHAEEDCVLYSYLTPDFENVKVLIDVQNDYGACIITSIFNLVTYSFQALKKLENYTRTLNSLITNFIVYFWALKEETGFSHTPSSKYFREGLDNLQKMRDKNFPIPYEFTPDFFDKEYSNIYETEESLTYDINTSRIDYYGHLSNLPMETQKILFSQDMFITKYNCTDISNCLADIQSSLKDEFLRANNLFCKLYSEKDESIFSDYVTAVKEMKKNSMDTTTILQTLEYIVTKIKAVISMYESVYNHRCEIDIEYLKNALNQIKLSTSTTIEVREEDSGIPEELKDSALKIIHYSNIPKEKADLFLFNLQTFRKLKDKLSSANMARDIRSAITSGFFEIYEEVFKRVVLENDKTRLYSMFLNYGYMDEKLLNADQILALYKLAGKDTISGKVQVYTIKDWLLKIYNKERYPSVNEFGQDFFDIYRETKKKSSLTDRDQLELDNDIDGKLRFEIVNMFKINQRVCHGQMSVYFPILHTEMITKDLQKALITPEMINESINKILNVDFSIFHREISYRNINKGIEKEFIMKSVLPDIILIPTFGIRPVMWQDISRRMRNTPGRFILPVFTSENLDDMMVKIIGYYRWELCRTMMGTAWNDITLKSLTSEYTDYIQFYKKNRDLTEDAKEKVRALTVKYRNMMREIFASEYETWINYESKGNIRLNKIVRGIFYRNCPFSKPIREMLEKQPMYAEVALQFKNQRAKWAKEYENHYNKLIKSGIELDEDLVENLKFYRDL